MGLRVVVLFYLHLSDLKQKIITNRVKSAIIANSQISYSQFPLSPSFFDLQLRALLQMIERIDKEECLSGAQQ